MALPGSQKHPLGIISACEDTGLVCTIFQHWDDMKKPIIFRHEPKGGRFLDGMYTSIKECHTLQVLLLFKIPVYLQIMT
jgi:hypothetical protein